MASTWTRCQFIQNKKKIKGNVIVVMSDGELNEGTTWESAMFASHHKLNNLIVFLDNNGYQALGKTKDIISNSNINEKFNSFGWDVIDENESTLMKNTTILRSANEKPLLVNYKSTKGDEISFMKDSIDWHYKSLSSELIDQCLNELGLSLEEFKEFG